jgi:hypothetical protein
MYIGSDSVLTPEISGGNQNPTRREFITVTLPSLEDFIEGRVRLSDDEDEPQVSVVGRPSLNAEGVQDEATADYEEAE